MTVQQDRPTTAVTALPTPRTADQDAVRPPPYALAPGDWATRQEQLICWAMVGGMLALGLFAVLGVWLGDRVW